MNDGNDTKKKTILVTGGAGFIGSHLCERLIKDGHAVISLDNYFTGSRENHVDGVDYREGHTKDIEQLIPEDVDLIYHLGEYARPEQSLDEPREVWELNKKGTFEVLEFCRKNNIKLVYAGSSTKFGDGDLGRSQSPYAWTKASNTELIRNYGSWYGLSYAITYFHNVYGGRELAEGKYATLIGIYKSKYKKKEPLGIVSPGTQRRNFTHIDDIVEALVLVGAKGEGDEYGIGHPESFSIKEVANMFGTSVEMLPERAGNRMEGKADTTKTEELGWKPQCHLKDHIQDFVRVNKK